MLTNKTVKVIQLIAILLCILSSSISGFIIINCFEIKKEEDNRIILVKDVNYVVKEMIRLGRETEVINFYDKYVGNKSITFLIISTALLNDLPIHYFMSLAYTESRFYANAIGKNVDASGNILSCDYGLFQLNSITYKEYEKEYLLIPENNARLAADHLVKNLSKYKNWYEAFIAYNAGNTEYVKNKTIKHLVSIMKMNAILDKDFSMEAFNEWKM